MRRSLILALGLAICAHLPAHAAAKDKAEPPKPASPSAGHGEMIDDAAQYKHCVALARQKPADGLEEARAWGSLGGGEPARHCAAIALFGLGQYEDAARRLEELAQTSHREERLRAAMLAQAGQAWILAKQPEKAYAAQTAALKLMPGAPDLLVDRAESLAEAKNYKDALADLDQALAGAPNRVDALTFRATAKRYLDDLKGAGEDIAKALKIDPLYQNAWLENGILKRLGGDIEGARAAWSKVLEIAPNSPAADSARHNIELLDVKSR